MQLDVVDLRDFYNRPLGGVVRRLLTSRIRARWRSAQGSQLMGSALPRPTSACSAARPRGSAL